jgi:exosortase
VTVEAERHRRRTSLEAEAAADGRAAATGDPTLSRTPGRFGWQRLALAAAVLAPLFAWGYWPAIGKMVAAWSKQADYSHGFLVAPLALVVLWVRRDRFPGLRPGLSWAGLVPLAMSLGLRFLAGLWYMDALDAWSILFWLGGVVWILFGRRVLWWSLPSIAFLGFMIPLPFRVERWVSYPLQGIATKLSSWALQCLWQPALPEGNTIFLGPHQLEVAEACSGLRIFVGVFAIAYVYAVLVRQSWWERMLMVVSTIPIALVSNAARIVVTGLLYRLWSEEAGKKFSHDVAGWGMILFAAALFALLAWQLKKFFPQEEVVDVRAVLRAEIPGRG